MNYTGISQSIDAKSFVWRGYMLGVDCTYASKCSSLCESKESFKNWEKKCKVGKEIVEK